MAGFLDDIIKEAKQAKAERGSVIVDLSEPKDYLPEDIRTIREKSKMDISAFADYVGVSDATVKAWEKGEKKPGASALKALAMIEAEYK